jgi:transcriptional regulator with XRE-family HTH domain
MEKDIYALVGACIREERKRAGLTLEELAGQAGVSASFLAYIEGNARKPSLATVDKLARGLGLAIDELFKTPFPRRHGGPDAAALFAQSVRDMGPGEKAAALDIVRAASRALRRRR